MKEETRQSEIHKSLFVQLVMMLATSASQAMGKLVNPATKKTDVSLGAAEATIDLLDMLEAKTRGNLDRDEERLLKDTLMSLKLTFVETRNAQPAAPAPEPAPGKEPEPKVEAGSDKKAQEPRFHKSY